MLDFSWFSLSNTGVLMVSWVGCFKDEVQLRQKPLDLGGKTVCHDTKTNSAEKHVSHGNNTTNKHLSHAKAERKPRYVRSPNRHANFF